MSPLSPVPSRPVESPPVSQRKAAELTDPRGGTSTVTSEGLIRTVVFLSPEERRALKIAAAERDCSGSDVIRAALRAQLGLGD